MAAGGPPFDAARVRALAACKDFLALWKDADPDIPILKKAKAECAKPGRQGKSVIGLTVRTNPSQCLISRVISMGRRNTHLEPTLR
jgi:hypothetical protein